MLSEAIELFNQASLELQSTEFRRPRSQEDREWLRNNPPQDYGMLFAAVVPMLDAWVLADPPDSREGAAKKLNVEARAILRKFAFSMVALSVERQTPELISQGLIAIAILGGVDDYRDLSFYLADLRKSADTLGIDRQAVFNHAASMCAISERTPPKAAPRLLRSMMLNEAIR
jgi:hypothetical protein